MQQQAIDDYFKPFMDRVAKEEEAKPKEVAPEKQQIMYHYGLVEEAIERMYQINNRKERRPAQREYEKIVEVVYEVEVSFINDVFKSEHTDLTYQQVYEFYHNKYVNNIMYIVTKLKPKFWKLDRAAFSRKFRPQI